MPGSFSDFYRGKRVLVSGHTGFAGGWLAAWLKLLGAKVSGYGLPPSTRPNFFDATLLDRGMTSIFGDLRNREALANLFAEFQPEIVIHYAGQISAQRASQEPVEAFATNVMGTVHILEEARQIDSVGAVVVANIEQRSENRNRFRGFRGECTLGGHDPYTSSAACAELAVSAYIGGFFHDSKTAVATTRTGQSIGGGDWAQGETVPEIVRGITSGEPTVISDSPAVRPWQHVLETVRAQLLMAQKLSQQGQEFSGAWNFAPPDEDTLSVRQLAERFVKGWDAGELVFDSEEADSEEGGSGENGSGENGSEENGPEENDSQPLFRLDTQKAESRLSWSPVLCIGEAIAWTVEWYKAFYADPSSSRHTTEDQIQQFMKAAAE